MAAPTIRLVFTDGSKEEVSLNPRVLVETERQFGANPPPMEATMYGAWVRLGRPATFEEWLDTVEAIDTDEAPGAVLPSPPAASAGS